MYAEQCQGTYFINFAGSNTITLFFARLSGFSFSTLYEVYYKEFELGFSPGPDDLIQSIGPKEPAS